MDEWDLLDEVDVIALWPAEQKKNVESAKWQERKEALEELYHLIEKNPRLSSASLTIYGEVMDNLKKIIARDSNINVVIAALHVLKGLARGLRSRFACYISMIWSVMLDKSKDKKANVRDALSEALDAVSDTCEAERLSKDLCEHLSKPNPQSKQCLCSFLYRYFIRQLTVSMEFAKAVLPVVVKLASDSDPAVRDAACNSLGSARRLLGKGLDAFLNPLLGEKAKLDKIEEYCQEATKQHAEFMASRPQPGTAGGTTAVDSADGVEPAAVSASNANQEIDPWTLMDPTDVVGKMRKDFDELIASKKWQERKEAVESVLSIMESAPRVAMSPELQQVILVLIKVLEKDVNINVSSLCAKVLAKLAASMRTDFAGVVPKIMPIAFDKLKEKKAVLRNELIELCDAASFTVSLDSYSEAVCGGLTKSNPQSKAQTAQFTARLLSRHDSSTVPVDAVKQIVPDLIKCSSDADAEVRESAFRAMAAVLRCVGEPAARRLFGEISEDKIRMGKIMEFVEKIREEFGEKAVPEIIRLHGSAPKKPKVFIPLPAATQPSAAAPARKPASAARPAHRPATVTRPSTISTSAANRVPHMAMKRPNVVKAPLQQQTQRPGQGRTPLSTRAVQPVARGVSSNVKPGATPSGPPHRAHARPVFAPNVVRATNGQPVNVPNRPRPTGPGPVKITNNPSTVTSNGHAMGKNVAAKVNTGLPRSNSGLRPPTAVSRIPGTGIPRLSRPSSPAK
ncbi:HEAT repeat protein [Oesophagostomum dentatum]|uniref:HEAT repeat protein n=1 Tax=Oesophagostomum dentatum TaxID=61180 RepID=A0A0B1T553_OESDE|nr:HEAT repeat protein [Oesophagostomum dentatum]